MVARSPLAWVMIFLLWVSVIVSSFAVVLTTYQVRSQTNHLEKLRREASDLRVEWGRYLLEQSTWGSYGRIEKIASEQLRMKVPTGEEIEIITADKIR